FVSERGRGKAQHEQRKGKSFHARRNGRGGGRIPAGKAYPSQSKRTMSKQINVNPNFYKDGGREHTEGGDKGDSRLEDKGAMSKSRQTRGKEGQPNFIPGEAPVGEPGRKK